MPRLIFVRDHPADIHHRYAMILVDGAEVGKMGYGETLVCEVAPGTHTVLGRNEIRGGVTQIEVAVKEGQELSIQVGAVPTGCFAILMWVFPPAPTILLVPIEDQAP